MTMTSTRRGLIVKAANQLVHAPASPPDFCPGPQEFDDALDSLVGELKRADETTAAAYERLLRDDRDCRALYSARDMAKHLRLGVAEDTTQKAQRLRSQAYDELDEMAKAARRPGESFEQAYDRLAISDDRFRSLYKSARELPA